MVRKTAHRAVGRTTVVLLVVAVLAATGLLGFSYLGSPHPMSISTATTSSSTEATQTSTTFTQTATSGPIVSVNASPYISSIQDWNVSITGYSYPPNFVSFDQTSGEIYLSGAPSAQVTMVDSTTHIVSGTFEIPGTIYVGPIRLDSKAGTLLAFADICNGETAANASTCNPGNIEPHLFVLNEGTKAVIREFPVSGGDYGVDFATGTLYTGLSCPNPSGGPMDSVFPNCGFLTKYDLMSGALLANVSLDSPPGSIAVNSDTGMVYIVTGSTFGASSEEFFAFNGTSDQVLSKISFNTISSPVLQVDPSTNTVFSLATNGSSTVITAINGATGRILYSSPIGSACSVDSNRYYVNPVTNQIYASGDNGTGGDSNYLLVVNASDGRLVNMVSTLGNVYEDSTSNPSSGEAYLLAGEQLVALPAVLSQTYVNPSLLTYPSCFDEPV